MLFSKRGRKKSGEIWHDEKSLYPILHVAGSLKDYQKELARKEVESLSELSMVGSSFSCVLSEADNFQTQLQDFGQSFSNINEAAGQFGQVREDITQMVSGAQDLVEELKVTSAKIQNSYRTALPQQREITMPSWNWRRRCCRGKRIPQHLRRGHHLCRLR